MRLTANIIGATGLTGRHLIGILLKDDRFSTVRIFVRRDSGIQHPKLEQQVIDFSTKKTWQDKLKGDVLFSALGTTLKQAGSKEKEYDVDFTLNLDFAREAKRNGIENYVLVSSIGANPKSRLFYPRMKGELDDAVSQIGFKNLVILRPSALTGKREKNRWMEKLTIPLARLITRFMFKKYRPIEGKTVAQAMIAGVLHPHPGKTTWEGDEIFILAKSSG